MIRKLPVARPAAQGYQFYAYPLSILGTRPESKDWILSNYIQTAYDTSAGSDDVSFCFYLHDHTASPWLQVVKLDRSWVGSHRGNVVDWVRDVVGEGYYVSLNLDEFHIEGREAFGRFTKIHDVLVTGIDDDRGIVHILGYNGEHLFREAEISQAGLRAAYESALELTDDDRVHLFRMRENVDYGFDLDLVRRTLEEYLGGVNTSLHFSAIQEPWDRLYGMDTYGPLGKELETYLADRSFYVVRSLSVLWEHKRLMADRMERMAQLYPEELRSMVVEARSIEVEARRLRNAMLTHRWREGRTDFAATAIPSLEKIAVRERRLITDCLSAMP